MPDPLVIICFDCSRADRMFSLCLDAHVLHLLVLFVSAHNCMDGSDQKSVRSA